MHHEMQHAGEVAPPAGTMQEAELTLLMIGFATARHKAPRLCAEIAADPARVARWSSRNASMIAWSMAMLVAGTQAWSAPWF